VTELSAYVLAKLREGEFGEFTLYRGLGDGVASILLVAPAGEYPSPGSLQHLEHEYALRADLDANWAARPVRLVRREARLMLVLEDPGGEPLERLLGRPMEVGQFLRIAVPLAAAIGQMHARGLIHKDLKPANILVDVASGGAWLTGFGIASRLPRERQAPAPPEVIAGTLAYMAPEQTGRMNRSIDSRSDLYALGVTLYEMLTGVLPFTASDPMEWIHRHVARRPTAPSERVSGIPDPVEAVILKLLAKTAEDRYQTAAGVEADLRRCLSAWEAHRRIDPFPLAAHDVSGRLAIPERLYGREAEIAALLVAFDRVVTQGATELVLVSGYAGIGKSSIANELHKMLVPRRGLFATGKFDQYKRDIPYATLAQAFQSLVRQLLSADDEELSCWRNALLEALGPNGQLMVNLIPELALIIGQPPPLPDLPPQDRQARFQLVFRRLLGVFARPEHPLVLFLDDLQWLDAATLELIAHLVTEPEVRHLMLVGAYRGNEVDPSHPLMRTLEMIRKAGGKVEEIVLAPLKPGDVGQLIADSLHCEREIARPLAQLVHEKTDGNPFFAIQFFMALAEEALLVFDHGAAAWTWDLHRIRAKGFTDNVADLMAAKLSRLPDVTQAALGQLACLGNVAQVATIALVHGESEEKVHEGLWEAVRTGLVFRLGDGYAFLHDRVQEAAYALIPELERAATHLRIGRALASRIAPEELEEVIFDVVNHLNRGAEMIATQEEREKVAELNLMAGKRAKNASAYASALTYFASGAALLADDSWARRPELTLALELNRAECEFQTGALTAAEQRLTALSPRAATMVERASVTCLQADLYTTLDQGSRAIAVGLDYLRHLGIDWSSHPTDDEVHREYLRIWSTLGDRPIEILAELPLMSDPASLATLDVLTKISAPAWYTDANLASLVICRVVNVSLGHGNCDGSCYAYVVLGLIAGTRFGDYQAGFRFGRLGYDLVEQRGLKRFQARTYSVFGNMVLPWTKHVRTGRDLVRRAFEAANKSGDLTFAGYCGGHLNTNLLAAGDPLDEVQGEAERGLAFAQKVRFGIAIDAIAAQLGLIRTLRGLTANFGHFDDEQFDELRMEHRFSSNPDLAGAALFYWIRKLQARFFAGDYAAALEAAERAQRTIWTSPSHFETAEYEFYGALAQAALWESAAASQRRQRAEAVVAHHRKLEIWAANCPENFENRAALVGGEIARIEGRDADAMRLYEQAIRSARSNGFVHNEGLANELAARFYAARGFEKIAHVYLRDARYCYLRWGAEGKVRQLEQSHPLLREEAAPARLTTTMEAPQEQLDLATVVKIYQTVSGEIVLEKLIETLMVIAVEHAGAERGLLVLPQGDVQQIEAEATTGRDAVVVRLLGTPATPSDLPGSVLQYVIRTGESVILNDASAQNPFLGDEYIRQKRARSVLCLPLVKQAKLIGVLYLENNLASHVFTPARISVLKLLSSQAAISLENARLYAKLSNENRERRKAEEDLRRSEAALTEAQQISHTGSWRWKVGTGEVSWSAEHFRIFAFDPATTRPSYGAFMERIDAEDRPAFEQAIQRAVRERSRFQHEYRIVLPDGSVKHLQSVGQADVTESSDLEFVGTVMDITERRHAEEALRSTQAELARVARLTTMGELAASLSHEINQPLGAIVTLGEAGLRWLNREEPDLDEARDALSHMVRDAERAGGVIRGLRALAKKSGPQVAKLDINDAIREVLTLTRSELQRHGVAVRTEPSADDRPAFGDRVQLQQVLLNLIMNAVESMSAVTDRPKMLTITSEPIEPDGLLVAVEDTGTGIDPAIADRIFDSFITTKPEGMGMGLSICRSIIAAHGGRISASPRVPYGTVFRFTVPGIPPA
jgi:predicted ATPase/signal transduction histidine kinase